MRTVKYKQLIGEIVELKDSFRIYAETGLFYITKQKEKAFEIADALLKGQEVNLRN